MLRRIKQYFNRAKEEQISATKALKGIPLILFDKIFRQEYSFSNVFLGFGYYSKPLLVSYSRSGTNWIRYFIEIV